MTLKKFGLTLVAVLALGAVMASSALAAAKLEPSRWRADAGGTVLTGTETITSTGSGKLITTVGETPLILDWTGLECLECKITNSSVEASGEALGSGKLKFTGVTVETPSACAVSGGSITTVALAANASYMSGTENFVNFKPAAGSNLVSPVNPVTLVKGSGTCAIAGSYIVKGNVFVKTTNATGVYAVEQEVKSSGAINSGAGGELFFGSKVAELEGSAKFALSGAKKGVAFGTK